MDGEHRGRRPPAEDEAWIIVRGTHSIPCRVLDSSEGVARLYVYSVLGIPDDFVLMILKTGQSVRAQVVSRKPNEIGARLLDEVAQPD